MKKLLLLCFLGGFMFMQSCKDDCEDVTCFNGGICDDGTCQCEDGYTGSTCEDEERAGLIGTWVGNTICPDEPAEATTFSILAGNSITEILISDGTDDLAATVTGVNTFELDPFTIDLLGFMVTTSGDGSINASNQLEMNINSSIAGIGESTCVFTGAQ